MNNKISVNGTDYYTTLISEVSSDSYKALMYASTINGSTKPEELIATMEFKQASAVEFAHVLSTRTAVQTITNVGTAVACLTVATAVACVYTDGMIGPLMCISAFSNLSVATVGCIRGSVGVVSNYLNESPSFAPAIRENIGVGNSFLNLMTLLVNLIFTEISRLHDQSHQPTHPNPVPQGINETQSISQPPIVNVHGSPLPSLPHQDLGPSSNPYQPLEHLTVPFVTPTWLPPNFTLDSNLPPSNGSSGSRPNPFGHLISIQIN